MELLPNYHRKKREGERLIATKKILVDQCKKCDGSGLRFKVMPKIKKGMTMKDLEDKVTENRVTCSCMKKYKWIENLLISGIRKEFWNCEDWDLLKRKQNKENWDYIDRYLENLSIARHKGIGFMFFGNNGTGKTSAGMLALITALRQNYTAHYICMRDLLSELRILTLSDKAYDVEEVKGFIDEVCEVDFLFIDEVGKAKASEFTQKEFEGFIRKRVANGLPTILATNLTKKQIHDAYGESLDDLIWGSMKELTWVGGSYRKTRKTKIIDDFFERKRRAK